MTPVKVPSDRVAEFWHLVAPVLETAVKRGGERTLDGIKADCADGLSQLWVSGNSAMISELLEFPDVKRAVCVVAGGNLKDFKATWPAFLKWAKGQDCDEVEIVGRKGWIKELGLEEHFTIGRIGL